jgi:hypothetical protein
MYNNTTVTAMGEANFFFSFLRIKGQEGNNEKSLTTPQRANRSTQPRQQATTTPCTGTRETEQNKHRITEVMTNHPTKQDTPTS